VEKEGVKYVKNAENKGKLGGRVETRGIKRDNRWKLRVKNREKSGSRVRKGSK